MKKIHVHFMGIGGSGMSGVAKLAQEAGYKVTGCDLQATSPYLKTPVEVGHSEKHLEGVDILAVTPAAFFQATEQAEFKVAKERGILMKWQEFLGGYLQKDKVVISIAGTHGKSTTTALISEVFVEAGVDPSVMIGATIKKWGENYRSGKGEFFITESDEFSDNFLAYNPEVIILNNIEFDHSDYFASLEQVLESFAKFIRRIRGKKILIVNQDSVGIASLFKILGDEFLAKLEVYGYTNGRDLVLKLDKSLQYKVAEFQGDLTVFEVKNSFGLAGDKFTLKLSGEYNVANACGVLIASSLLGIDNKVVQKSFAEFTGIGRRQDLIGTTSDNILVYDDYAHHPTALSVTLRALSSKHPNRRLWAIVEPHTFSRTKSLLNLYKNAFVDTDLVLIAPIYRSRDKEDYGVSNKSIVEVSEHENISAMEMDEIVKHVTKEAKRGDVIAVFGAGKSYQLARDILASLGKRGFDGEIAPEKR